MSPRTLLAALLLAGGSDHSWSEAAPWRREPEPPTPDPTWGQGAGAPLLLPVPRKGRECPTCGRILGLDVRICAGAFGDGHRAVKTRRVVLDRQGQPVRRRR